MPYANYIGNDGQNIFHRIVFTHDYGEKIDPVINKIISNITKEQIDNLINKPDAALKTPLHYAVEIGDIKLVKFLLRLGANQNDADNNGHNILDIVTNNCNIKLINFLFNYHINTRYIDNLGRNLIHVAITSKNTKLAKDLLTKIRVLDCDLISSILFQQEYRFKRNIIHLATANKELELLSLLIILIKQIPEDKIKELLDQKDYLGNSPIHIAAKLGDDYLMDKLIKMGYDIDAQNNMGHTASHIIAKEANCESIEYILKLNANFLIEDLEGFDALDILLMTNDVPILRYLAKITDNALLEDIKSLDKITKKFEDDINLFSKIGDFTDGSPMRTACTHVNQIAIEYFLAKGIKLTDPNKSPESPLEVLTIMNPIFAQKYIAKMQNNEELGKNRVI